MLSGTVDETSYLSNEPCIPTAYNNFQKFVVMHTMGWWTSRPLPRFSSEPASSSHANYQNNWRPQLIEAWLLSALSSSKAKWCSDFKLHLVELYTRYFCDFGGFWAVLSFSSNCFSLSRCADGLRQVVQGTLLLVGFLGRAEGSPCKTRFKTSMQIWSSTNYQHVRKY